VLEIVHQAELRRTLIRWLFRVIDHWAAAQVAPKRRQACRTHHCEQREGRSVDDLGRLRNGPVPRKKKKKKKKKKKNKRKKKKKKKKKTKKKKKKKEKKQNEFRSRVSL